MCRSQHGGGRQYSCPDDGRRLGWCGHDETRARGDAEPGSRSAFRRLAQPSGYLTVTVAPAPSRAARALSALSLLTFSSTVLGAPSTRSLASLRPRLVRLRTSLMTWIFLSPAASRMTSNSSCSSACSASPAPAPAAAGPAATATGAAAFTSNVSSNCFTNSESSSRVISLNASRRSSVLIFAMVVYSSFLQFLACGVGSAFVARRVLRVGGAGLGCAGFWGAGFRSAAFGGRALGAQRLGELGQLHRQRVERRGRAGQRRLHGAGQLGQQHLARLQVGQLGDLRRAHRLA